MLRVKKVRFSKFFNEKKRNLIRGAALGVGAIESGLIRLLYVLGLREAIRVGWGLETMLL